MGGGNHFCELQAVEGLTDGGRAAGLDDQGLYLLVHSGSRALGATVFSETVAAHSGLTAGLDPGSETGAAWLASHDRC
ncbi:RtcB family protein, partial [Rhizobium ruizarguesonis]